MNFSRILSIGLAIVLAAAVFPSRSRIRAADDLIAADEPASTIKKGEIVVEIRPGASIESVNERNRTSTIVQIYGTNFYRLQIPPNKKEKKWRKRLAADPDVLSASLNPLMANPSLFARATASFPDGFATPGFTSAAFGAQHDLFDLLQLEEVGLRSRGAGTVVAIIDTGIDRNHPALAGHMWRNTQEQPDGIDNDGDGLIDDIDGWNFVAGNNDTNEKPGDPITTVAGHGTFIAGLVSMLAPECKLMPVRAFPEDGVSDAFTVASAIKFAADHGADVINLSLGSSVQSELLENAVIDARSRGITLVAAVGNDNTESDPQFPSSMVEVMAVAAIQLSGQKASFSNFGKHVDVSAPGVQLISTFPGSRDGEYARWSGTSFAAPLAAAEAALVASVVPRQPDVRRIVEETAAPLDQVNPGFAGKLGKGRIDPLRALQSLNDSPTREPIDVRSQIVLSRGPAGGSSFGGASVNVRGDRQEFVVEAHMLGVRSTYRLLVDGKELSSAVSASLGSARFVFGTEPGDLPLPPSINPVTRVGQIELRDSLNRVVLQGSFAAGTSDPSGGFVESEALLSSSLPGSSAAGNASIRIEALADGTRREQLGVSAEGLVSGDVYRLIVDGLDAGSTMVRSGFLRLLLTSDGVNGQLLPPVLRPVTNIRHVELRDSRGNVSLQGDFTGVHSR